MAHDTTIQEIVSGKLFFITETYISALQNMHYQTDSGVK